MRHGLDYAVVNGETCLYEVLAVACYSGALNGDIGVHLAVNALYLIGYLVKGLTQI